MTTLKQINLNSQDDWNAEDQERIARQDRDEFGDPEDGYDESADLEPSMVKDEGCPALASIPRSISDWFWTALDGILRDVTGQEPTP